VTSDPNGIMSPEELFQEVGRVKELLNDCLDLNNCARSASVYAMFILIIKEFSRQKMPWDHVEGYVKEVLEQAKPHFVSDQ
jgi:hypothetical protein